jgi:hypothetical protein
MNRLLVPSLTCTLTVSICCYAQTPQPDASKAHSQACVIVKRHVPKFGENMSRLHPHRPPDYVEGDYPTGFKWCSELGDGGVRELQKKGGKIVVMKPDYEVSDLEDARKQCQSQTVK